MIDPRRCANAMVLNAEIKMRVFISRFRGSSFLSGHADLLNVVARAIWPPSHWRPDHTLGSRFFPLAQKTLGAQFNFGFEKAWSYRCCGTGPQSDDFGPGQKKEKRLHR